MSNANDQNGAFVKAFQRLNKLKVDGIAGKATTAALQARLGSRTKKDPSWAEEAPPDLVPSSPALIINRSLRLPEDQYVPEAVPKDLIAIHHTAGGSAESSFNWWIEGDAERVERGEKPRRIATAFLVDRDGVIYEVFPPEQWAWHLGIGGQIEERSIGIELANYGWLKHRTASYVLAEPWRGQTLFESYKNAQTRSTIQLVKHLCERFDIPRDIPENTLDYQPELKSHKGIVGHCMVRADKTDPHPGFDWKSLRDALEVTP